MTGRNRRRSRWLSRWLSRRSWGWVCGWILASTAGWALASLTAFIGTWFLLEALTGSADEHLDTWLGASIGLTAAFATGGAGIGTAQWLLLRSRLDEVRSWIWTTALGWAAVAAIYSLLLDQVPVAVGEVAHSLTGGAIAGVLQARILRTNNVIGARRWPMVSCAAFLAAAAVGALITPLVGGDHSISAIAGMAAMATLEGAVLARLLSRTQPIPVPNVREEPSITL